MLHIKHRDRYSTQTNIWYIYGGSAGKESACNAGDLGSIPGLGRFPGEGKSYPLQYSGLENSMDYIGHRVAKSQRRPSDFHYGIKLSWGIFYSLTNLWGKHGFKVCFETCFKDQWLWKKKKRKTNDLQKKVKQCRGGIGASTLSLCVHREGGERERGKSVRNPYLDKAELSEYFALWQGWCRYSESWWQNMTFLGLARLQRELAEWLLGQKQALPLKSIPFSFFFSF